MDAQTIATILGAALAGSFGVIGWLSSALNKIKVDMATLVQKLENIDGKIDKIEELERDMTNLRLHIATSHGQ